MQKALSYRKSAVELRGANKVLPEGGKKGVLWEWERKGLFLGARDIRGAGSCLRRRHCACVRLTCDSRSLVTMARLTLLLSLFWLTLRYPAVRGS